MPAYFTVTFEVEKHPTAVRTFCETLFRSGLPFKSGFMKFESESFDDIVKWNQTKMDEDFEQYYPDSYWTCYKDILLQHPAFSEARLLIWDDNWSRTFWFHLLLPENDFLYWSDEAHSIQEDNEKMELVKSIAIKMWASTPILAIQTEWECSCTPPGASAIADGAPPQVEPFCIVRTSSLSEHPDLTYRPIEPDGALSEAPDNWFYVGI